MVKAADLGWPSANLQRVATGDEEKKDLRLRRALKNLTEPERPERLSRTSLPDSLLNLVGD